MNNHGKKKIVSEYDCSDLKLSNKFLSWVFNSIYFMKIEVYSIFTMGILVSMSLTPVFIL